MKTRFFLFGLILMSITSFAQSETDTLPPFRKYPIFPPVQLLKADSTIFTKEDLPKKLPVLLIVFSPDCEHCQHEAEELVKNADSFKNIQVVMATFHPLDAMKSFVEQYQLDKLEHLIVGQDNKYFLPYYFALRNLPLIAFYDKDKKLIDAHQGTMVVEKVLEKYK